MGLDMYLHRKTYVKRWSHQKEKEKFKVEVTKGGTPYTGIDPEKIKFVEEEVAYWRKANAIHNWFIENCAGGDGNKTEMDVTCEQLQELLNLCLKVKAASKLVAGKVARGARYEGGKMVPIIEEGKTIKDPTVAKELLPTASGFFFGSTDYDEWYLEGIQNTIDQLEPILALNGDESYYTYVASW